MPGKMVGQTSFVGRAHLHQGKDGVLYWVRQRSVFLVNLEVIVGHIVMATAVAAIVLPPFADQAEGQIKTVKWFKLL